MKLLILAVFFASICCVVIPINGQSARKNASAGKAKAANSQTPKIDAINVDTLDVAKFVIQEQPKTGEETYNNKNDSRSYFRRLFAPENLPNLILCAIGIAGVIVAVCTLKGISKQAELMDGQLTEMKTAGEQTARQLSLTERPWIAPSVYIISPLTADDNGIHITLRIELANVGNSPAVGIWIDPSLHLPHISKPNVVEERKRIYERVMAHSPKWGQILFPKTNPPYMQDFTISVTTEDVQKSRVGDGNITTGMIAPEIILCVAYRSTIDEKARHCTAFIYELMRFDSKNPKIAFAIPVGQSIPQEQLRLYGSIIGPIAE